MSDDVSKLVYVAVRFVRNTIALRKQGYAPGGNEHCPPQPLLRREDAAAAAVARASDVRHSI
jgi:hypothetical protein